MNAMDMIKEIGWREPVYVAILIFLFVGTIFGKRFRGETYRIKAVYIPQKVLLLLIYLVMLCFCAAYIMASCKAVSLNRHNPVRFYNVKVIKSQSKVRLPEKNVYFELPDGTELRVDAREADETEKGERYTVIYFSNMSGAYFVNLKPFTGMFSEKEINEMNDIQMKRYNEWEEISDTIIWTGVLASIPLSIILFTPAIVYTTLRERRRQKRRQNSQKQLEEIEETAPPE